ncbi:MAG: hypothetical protein DRJ66_03240 [Thermoprotei archaeon]|nr:MAG: hypothetical protein DRJ66_03240 [Thermoprotei archaeon]RLF21051.1 MAG: hypothetical protein DRZ82_00240 [Thermoprotei archaeon]
MNTWLSLLLKSVIFPGFLFIFAFALFVEWFERKLTGRMENRMGPSYTGPFGVLQPFADFIKLLQKETIDVRSMSTRIVDFMIIASLSLYILCALFIPYTGKSVLSFDGDVVLVSLLLSLASGLLYFAGLLSRNAFTVVGAVRLLLQVVALDIPLVLLAIVPVIITGRFSIVEIAHRMPESLIYAPFLIPFWLVALMFEAITEQAEIERNPFSMPHAETEIVAGYITEFSGVRLALVNLARDVQLTVTSSFLASIFLSGLLRPVSNMAMFINVVLLILETLLIVFVATEIKCITARLRIDIALDLFWKYIIPLCTLLVILLFSVKVIAL